jgi:dienelactone hydrolase
MATLRFPKVIPSMRSRPIRTLLQALIRAFIGLPRTSTSHGHWLATAVLGRGDAVLQPTAADRWLGISLRALYASIAAGGNAASASVARAPRRIARVLAVGARDTLEDAKLAYITTRVLGAGARQGALSKGSGSPEPLPNRSAWFLLTLLLFSVMACGAPVAQEQWRGFVREELRIPLASAAPQGLEAVLLRPVPLQRYPLLLINHGLPRSAVDRTEMTPLGFLPQALEFARRGWAVVIVMRRGFGNSGGAYAEDVGSCGNPDYAASAIMAASDMRATIEYLARRPDVDAARVVSVGHSVGGLATVALTADPPPGLVAGISFAGGKGSPRDGEVCSPDRLIAAYRMFGRRSQIAMLWIYAENDLFFGPELAQQLHAAFLEGGGRAEFIKHPAFGRDGHALFMDGIALWTGYVDDFLRRQKLAMRETPLPLAIAAIAPPPQLSQKGVTAFLDYLAQGPHKAFFVSSEGAYGWRSGRRTLEVATQEALENCRKYSGSCALFAVDDEAVPAR